MRRLATLKTQSLTVPFVLFAFACTTQQDSEKKALARSSANENWTLRDVPVPVDSSKGQLTFEFVESKRYGTEEGEGWLSSFQSVAVSESTVAVGGGIRNCEVVVFHRASARELARFGQCGGGPQDLERVSVLAAKSDSIAVVDRGGSRFQIFNARGEHSRTQLTNQLTRTETVTGVFDVAWVHDSIVVYVVRYRDHERRAGQTIVHEPDSPFVRIHSAASGRRLASAGVEGGAVGKHNFGEEREMSACVVPRGTKDGRAAIVVFNRWAAQVVSYDLDSLMAARPAVIMNRVVPELPIGAFKSERSPVLMTAHYIHAKCGDRLALGQYLRYRNPDPTVRLASEAYFVAVSPGTAEHGVRFTKEEHLLGRLMGANGNTFYFGHQARFAYPMVVAAELHTKPQR